MNALFTPSIPSHLARNFRYVRDDELATLTDSLINNYFIRRIWGNADLPAEEYLHSEAGKSDMANHMDGRLREFREVLIPWLDSVRPLDGTRILEIGCGTGSSTLALAEQGATVTAVDIDGASIQVAKDRLNGFGVDADFVEANATEVHRVLGGNRFDIIIFFATLEHLTHDERLAAIEGTWNMLDAGSLWAVVETPNRLWYFDHHTSHLPFYSWLPDDLAFKCSRFSPRPFFKDAYTEASDTQMKSFLGHGRGVSFHEFDLSMGPTINLEIASSVQGWSRQRSLLRRIKARIGRQYRYRSLLKAVGPPIHEGFYERDLYLIIRKT